MDWNENVFRETENTYTSPNEAISLRFTALLNTKSIATYF